jgi:hypothetical protein
MTVEEARAKGIDVDHLAKVDGPTDATSPVGTTPSSAAVSDLEKKVQELKVANSSVPAADVTESKKSLTAVPLPGGEPPKSEPHLSKLYAVLIPAMTSSEIPGPPPKEEGIKHDLPAQNETRENHTSIPMPVITAISDRDPSKDRTVDAPFSPDTAGTKPISSDPAVDPKVAKKEAEQNPALTGSTKETAKNSANTNLGGHSVATNRPDAPETNHSAPAPIKKDIAPGEATPAPVAKDAPGTPTKTAAPVTATNGAPSAPTTPATTPAKSTHGREASNASDPKKRKSGFLSKVSHLFPAS